MRKATFGTAESIKERLKMLVNTIFKTGQHRVRRFHSDESSGDSTVTQLNLLDE